MEIQLDEVLNDDLGKNLKFIDHLGSGSYGEVIRVLDLKLNKEVAVKIIKKSKSSNRINWIKQEIKILQKLSHKNIVEFLGYREANYKLFIVMELLRGGTIKALLEKREKINEYLSELEISIIMKSLLEAVKYIHNKDIIHRDIKPINIMFENEEDLTSLKLIDFGVSAQNVEDDYLVESCGTFNYMAPEQIEKKAYSKPIDLWACGIILYILLNQGKHPVYTKGISKLDFLFSLKNCKWECKNNVSPIAKSLLVKLLEINPSKRYNADKALNHPFITRNKLDNIPKTYFDELRISSIKRKFKEIIGINLFLKNFAKNKKNKLDHRIDLLKYVTLVNEVSREQKENFKNIKDKMFDINKLNNSCMKEKEVSSSIFCVLNKVSENPNIYKTRNSDKSNSINNFKTPDPRKQKMKINPNFFNFQRLSLSNQKNENNFRMNSNILKRNIKTSYKSNFVNKEIIQNSCSLLKSNIDNVFIKKFPSIKPKEKMKINLNIKKFEICNEDMAKEKFMKNSNFNKYQSENNNMKIAKTIDKMKMSSTLMFNKIKFRDSDCKDKNESLSKLNINRSKENNKIISNKFTFDIGHKMRILTTPKLKTTILKNKFNFNDVNLPFVNNSDAIQNFNKIRHKRNTNTISVNMEY